jgi:ketosteroid isomerase-like protein
MKTFGKSTLIAATLAFAAVAAPLAALADSPATTVRSGTEAWLKAYNAGNIDAIIPLYSEDAIVMPPGAPPAKGHAAIRQFLTKDIAGAKAAGVTLVPGTVSDVGVKGDLAWHSGNYTVQNKAGATVDTGAFVEIWRKSGSKWVIIRDIWNSSTPPAPSAAPAPAPAAPKK